MTAPPPTISLRPATPADRDLLARVYASTREAELAAVPWSDEQRAAFLALQFAAQSAHYARARPDASSDVVLADGEPAGRLIVDRREDAVDIVDIALLPPYRSRGIGSRLLQRLIDEAAESGVPLGIHVERSNPARRLYERLGFHVAGDDGGVYLAMERPPAADHVKTASSTVTRSSMATDPGPPRPMAEITRRSLLATGAAAGAGLALGARPWAVAPAEAAATLATLRRSAYAGLDGSAFAVTDGPDTVVLRLVGVSDLAGRPALAGREDAFALRLSGPVATPLDSGIHRLAHERLGSFDLFLSPVGAVEADRRYEVVVDRSVGVPKSPPSPPAVTAVPAAVAAPAVAGGAERAQPARLLARATVRRLGRGATADVLLRAPAERVRVRLVRKGTTVAAGTAAVRDRRAGVRLRSPHTLAAGAYVLVVSTIDAHGVVRTQRSRIALR